MITDSFVDEVLARVAADQRVRRELPGGGRLYLDRRLPFLCVYRRPVSADGGSEQLVSSQAAYLIASGGRVWQRSTVHLLRSLVSAQIEHFGGFLILELWASPTRAFDVHTHEESGEPLAPSPWFLVKADYRHHPSRAVDTLIRSLRRIRLLRQAASVELQFGSEWGPPQCPPLMPPRELRRMGCHAIGLEVRPVYRDPKEGEVFPKVVRSLRRSLGRAFNQTFFTFARSNTNIRPRHYHTLGRRSFAKAVREADKQLASIETTFDLLLQATPTNAEAAWLEFRRRRFEVSPVFEYRPVSVEPGDLKRRLFQVPIDRIEDATLAHLLWEKQDELDRRITMLGDVGSAKFLAGSLQVYGSLDAALVGLASDILERLPARSSGKEPGRELRADEFAELARKEIAYYQAVDPTFKPEVTVRDDIFSGLLVSRGNLLIGRKTKVPAHRAEALVQHEIGTHLVTYHNGNCQPFRQLALGLAGYIGLQEGLAVLAEYLAGGLGRMRLRLLAARVLAVKSLLEGAGFIDTFRMLTRQFGFAQHAAYTITMRVYRGGGLTKDAGYLQGLVEILAYLGGGGEVEPLLAGRIAADHIPLIEELRLRQILRPPPLRPRYLDFPQYPQSIAHVRSGLTVIDLVKETKK